MQNIFLKESRQIEAPLTITGNKGEITGVGYKEGKTIFDFKDSKNPPEEFTNTVAIITNGHGIWNIEIPKKILKNLIELRLKIDTIRNHATLHSIHKDRGAKIIINDKLVDNIILKKINPFGDDYGIDSRRELPILSYIDKNKNTQTIKITTDEEVSWDVDQIILYPIIKVTALREWVYMVLGAVISSLFGLIIMCIIKGSTE
jgi:hypothetical protein